MGTPGSGLARGLAITFRAMTRRAHTRQYPDHEPELPPRSRGVIALFEENCTVCMLCARECPDWCIYIDSHKETVQVEGAARARQRNVLDRFAIDFSLCMYCGICIEVCPFDALFWSPEFEYAEYDIREMTHEKERLRDWMWTVPPPPALDPLAEPAKEVTAVEKARASAADKSDAGEKAGSTEKAEKAEKAERPARAPSAAKAAEDAAKAAQDAAEAAAGAAKAAEGAAKAAQGAAEAAESPTAADKAEKPAEKPAAKAKATPEAKAETDAKAEPEPDAKAEPEPDAEAEPEAEKPDAEAEPESKPKRPAKAKSEGKPEDSADAGDELHPGSARSIRKRQAQRAEDQANGTSA